MSDQVTAQTREEWLTLAGTWLMEDIIKPATGNTTVTPWRVSTGWPLGTKLIDAKKVLGACHPRSHSTDGHNEIFISPTEADSVSILATLLHEQIHAEDDCKSGHKGPFKRLALACGLEGKMTATVAGADLKEALQWWVDENGDMPHSAMDFTHKPKQSTRMLKVHCEHCEDFTARASRKVADAWAMSDAACPICNSELTFS